MLFISMIGLIIKFIRKVLVLQLFYLFFQGVSSLRFRANSQRKATGQIEKVCQLLCVQKQTSHWYDPCVQADIQWPVLEVKIFKMCGRSKGSARAHKVWGEHLQCSLIAEVLPVSLLLSCGGKMFAFPSDIHFSMCRNSLV